MAAVDEEQAAVRVAARAEPARSGLLELAPGDDGAGGQEAVVGSLQLPLQGSGGDRRDLGDVSEERGERPGFGVSADHPLQHLADLADRSHLAWAPGAAALQRPGGGIRIVAQGVDDLVADQRGRVEQVEQQDFVRGHVNHRPSLTPMPPIDRLDAGA